MSTLVFVLGWILLALAVVAVAMRSGSPPRDRPAHETRAGRRAFATAIAAIIVVFGIGVPAVAMIDNTDRERLGPAGVQLTAFEARGRELFVRNCGMCHTLAASASVGKVGPNLDVMRPPKALVIDAIENGRARGLGQMPAGLVTGRDAEAVAAFIERTAGR